MDNNIESFKDSMLNLGVTPPSVILDDGQIHRFSTNGKSNDLSGWYVLHTDTFPAGCFGDWRTGLAFSWGARFRMSTEDRKEYRKLILDAHHKRDLMKAEEQQAAAKRAENNWRYANPASPHHPYILQKRVSPYLARQRGNSLMLPVIDFDGKVWSLQFIDPTGSKMLLKGGAKKGRFIPVNRLKEYSRILICEGWATGCSLAEDDPTSLVLAAIDAGNLKSVAMAARSRWPDLEIVIAGDDDRCSPENPGASKAKAAAISAHAMLALPQWPEDAPEILTDFNDLANWLARGEA